MTTNDLRRKILSAEGLTDFQRRVYLALLDIPRGTTITDGTTVVAEGMGSLPVDDGKFVVSPVTGVVLAEF